MGLTDSSGNKVNSYDYDPFGVMLNQQEGVANPFKFAGGYLDASGFEQFGVRYYSPSLGRWTQQDPLAGSLFDLNSANRYVYAGDDPVNQVDPSGKDAVSCSLSVLQNGAYIAFYFLDYATAIQLISQWVESIPPPFNTIVYVVSWVVATVLFIAVSLPYAFNIFAACLPS